MLKTAAAIIVAMFLAFVTFGATSYAAGAVGQSASDGSLTTIARPVWDAIVHGQYWLAAALALVLVVAAARQYGSGAFPFLKTAAGGALLALVGSFGAAMAGFLAGAPMSWHALWMAAIIAVTASGMYSLLKVLLVDPVLVPLAAKYPKIRPLLALVLWIFDRLAKSEEPPAAAPPASRVRVIDHRTHPATWDDSTRE